MLVVPEVGDDANVIMELTAAVGGQESMLFTAEMLSMYVNHIAYRGWHVTADVEDTELGQCDFHVFLP